MTAALPKPAPDDQSDQDRRRYDSESTVDSSDTDQTRSAPVVGVAGRIGGVYLERPRDGPGHEKHAEHQTGDRQHFLHVADARHAMFSAASGTLPNAGARSGFTGGVQTAAL